MKKIISFILISFFVLNSSYAQTNADVIEKSKIKQKNIEEIQQKHAEYLIKELGLTEEQAIKFSPMMKDYMQKRFELYKNIHRAEKNILNQKNINDEEYKKLVDMMNDTKNKEIKLEKHYYDELSSIIGYEKVLKYDFLHRKTIEKTLQNSKK